MPLLFHCPDLDRSTDGIELEGEEVHHFRSVCRGKVGDRIELFDGAGCWAAADVLAVDRKRIRLHVCERRRVEPPTFGLTIAVAMPKGDRATVLVEKCNELGVLRLVPLHTERSVVEAGGGRLQRLRRGVIESCKQSGRLWRMEIDEPVPFERWAASTAPAGWILHPGGEPPADPASPPQIAAVGPEGGWTDREIDFARALGWRIVGIPGPTLRIETCAVALASWARIVSSRA